MKDTKTRPVQESQTTDRESALDAVIKIYPTLTDEEKLIGTTEYDEAYMAMSEGETEEFHRRLTEETAKRNPDIWHTLISAKNEGAGKYRFDEETSPLVRSALERFGFSLEAPSDEDIKLGIQKAKEIVGSGQAAEYLAQLPFFGESEYKKITGGSPVKRIRFEGSMFVMPDQISGSAGHDSWAGRGDMGRGHARSDKPGISTEWSIRKIEDFATRETQLPSMELYALDLIITNEGIKLFVDNAHRVSAAKLRDEPLRFDSLSIHDTRNSAQKQAT